MIGGYLNAHAALAGKRRNMVPFHIGRLAQDGLLPLTPSHPKCRRRLQILKTKRRKPSTASIDHHRLHHQGMERKSQDQSRLNQSSIT